LEAVVTGEAVTSTSISTQAQTQTETKTDQLARSANDTGHNPEDRVNLLDHVVVVMDGNRWVPIGEPE
jgi:hypothetical protein